VFIVQSFFSFNGLLDGPSHNGSDRPNNHQQPERFSSDEGPVLLLGITDQPNDRPRNIENRQNRHRPPSTISKTEPRCQGSDHAPETEPADYKTICNKEQANRHENSLRNDGACDQISSSEASPKFRTCSLTLILTCAPQYCKPQMLCPEIHAPTWASGTVFGYTFLF